MRPQSAEADESGEVARLWSAGGYETDIAFVFNERMLTGLKDTGRLCPWAQRADVDNDGFTSVGVRVVDDDPEMVFAVNFATAKKRVSEIDHALSSDRRKHIVNEFVR